MSVKSNFLLLSAFSLSAVSACASNHKVSKTPVKKPIIKTKKASSFPNTVNNPMPGEIIVKCAGIVKKGKNHCGANGHKCSGLSAENPDIKDFDKNEWIYLRKEVCESTPGHIVGKKRVVKG